MTITITKTHRDLFEAEATPPHSNVSWSTSKPLPIRTLIQELQKLGCHQTDIGDALYSADKNWESLLH